MQAAFVDIVNELADIRREIGHLRAALERADAGKQANSQTRWEQTHVRASAIEKVYSGCERILARIASEVDGAGVAHIDGWHTTLLKRMANPYLSVRGAVLSADSYARLDRLRAFRHRERNWYGIDLDADLVTERAREALRSYQLFEDDIRAFLADRGFDEMTSS